MPSRIPYQVEYETYLLEFKKFKPITLQTYTQSLEMLYAFIKVKYKKSQIEPVEIKPSDIKDFLQDKRGQGHSAQTLNKYITVFRMYFNFLWETDKISIDPVVKIKTFKREKNREIQITYEKLLELYPEIIHSSKYNLMTKCAFILAMKGIRFSELHFKKGDVVEDGSDVLITTKKRTIHLNGKDAEVFMAYFIECQFKPGEYVFTTKRQYTSEYAPIESDTLYMYFGYIRKDFDLPLDFSLDRIRKAYAIYLRTIKNFTVDDLARHFGINKVNAATLIQESIETTVK